MPRKVLKFFSLLICFCLLFEQSGFAQIAGQLDISGHIAQLRSSLMPDTFRPLHLRYLSYDALQNNFKLLLDKGDLKNLKSADLENSTKTLLNYFFVGISLPNDSFWVNLRPDSPDNIIDENLAQTDVGKILLEADLQLKKDTAQFTSPQTPEGKEYWDKLYQKAGEIFGSENITIPTLTRPWIVPDEIIIRESADNAYIYKATLKVMLEQDYLKDSAVYNFKDDRLKALNEYSSQLIRESIIPKITREVNTAKRYAPLRQVYYSLILAQWFKGKFYGKSGLYSWLIDRKNLTGLTSNISWSKATYFQAYQKSFKDGEYNIKEPAYTPYGSTIRSYFSGGIVLNASSAITDNLIQPPITKGLPRELTRKVSSAIVKGGDLQNLASTEITFSLPAASPLTEKPQTASSAMTQDNQLPAAPGIINIAPDYNQLGKLEEAFSIQNVYGKEEKRKFIRWYTGNYNPKTGKITLYRFMSLGTMKSFMETGYVLPYALVDLYEGRTMDQLMDNMPPRHTRKGIEEIFSNLPMLARDEEGRGLIKEEIDVYRKYKNREDVSDFAIKRTFGSGIPPHGASLHTNWTTNPEFINDANPYFFRIKVELDPNEAFRTGKIDKDGQWIQNATYKREEEWKVFGIVPEDKVVEILDLGNKEVIFNRNYPGELPESWKNQRNLVKDRFINWDFDRGAGGHNDKFVELVREAYKELEGVSPYFVKQNTAASPLDENKQAASSTIVSPDNPIVTFIDAEPAIKKITEAAAKRWFNDEMTKAGFLRRWWLRATGSAYRENYALKLAAELRQTIRDGKIDANRLTDLGFNSLGELIGSDENALFAQIAKRDFADALLVGERDVDLLENVIADQGIIDAIKGLILEYIRSNIDGEEFERRLRDEIIPSIRSQANTESIGSNLLAVAKTLKQHYQEQGTALQKLTLDDLNINLQFARPTRTHIQSRQEEGRWNQIIARSMNFMQRMPLRNVPILGALTSPFTVGIIMSIAGQAAVLFSRWGVRYAATYTLISVLFPVMSAPTLIAMGVTVVTASLVAAGRQNTEMWQNLDLRELGEALGAASNKPTPLEQDFINKGATVKKLAVETAIKEIQKAIEEYRNAADAAAQQSARQKLEELIADVIARLEYGDEVKAEFFQFQGNLRDLEAQRTALQEKVSAAMDILGLNRHNLGQFRAVVEQAQIKLESQFKESLDAFRKIKRKQVFIASIIAASIGLVSSLSLGMAFRFFAEWGGWLQTPKQAFSFQDFLKTHTAEFKGITTAEVQQALVQKGVAHPEEVISQLFPNAGPLDMNALSARMVSGVDKKLAEALEVFIEQKFGVELNFGAWSDPVFIKALWDSPDIQNALHKIGINNLQEFQQAFEQKVGNTRQGSWALYDTLKEILHTNKLAKPTETAVLEAILKNPHTLEHLQDVMRQNDFLRSETSVRRFFEGQNNILSTLERYERFVVNKSEYHNFVHQVQALYQNRGQSPDWIGMGKQVRGLLEQVNPADRVNLMFDWAHRFTEWNPTTTTGTPSEDFLKIFFDTTRSTQEVAQSAPLPNFLGPVITEAPWQGLGPVGKVESPGEEAMPPSKKASPKKEQGPPEEEEFPFETKSLAERKSEPITQTLTPAVKPTPEPQQDVIIQIQQVPSQPGRIKITLTSKVDPNNNISAEYNLRDIRNARRRIFTKLGSYDVYIDKGHLVVAQVGGEETIHPINLDDNGVEAEADSTERQIVPKVTPIAAQGDVTVKDEPIRGMDTMRGGKKVLNEGVVIDVEVPQADGSRFIKQDAVNIVHLETRYSKGLNVIGHNEITVMERHSAARPDTNALFVLDPTWIQNIDGRVFVRRALIFKEGRGNQYTFILVDFKDKPVEAHYLSYRSGDIWKQYPFTSNKEAKEATERPLLLPTSETHSFEYTAGNKPLTNALLQEAGVPVPASISFVLESVAPRNLLGLTEAVQGSKEDELVYVGKDQNGELVLKPAVVRSGGGALQDMTDFVREFRNRHGGALIVKPSDGFAGYGVTVFNEDATDAEIASAISGLLKKGESAIVQERIMPPFFEENGIKQDWNLRVFISRDAQNNPVVTGMGVRVDNEGKAVNISLTARAMTIEQVCQRLGLNESESRGLIEKIKTAATKAYATVDGYRRTDTVESVNNQHDFAGIDVMVRRTVNNGLEPVVIEVNGNPSGGIWHAFRVMRAVGQTEVADQLLNQYFDTAYRRGKQYKDEIEANAEALKHRAQLDGYRQQLATYLPNSRFAYNKDVVVDAREHDGAVAIIGRFAYSDGNLANFAILRSTPANNGFEVVWVDKAEDLVVQGDQVYIDKGIRFRDGKFEVVRYQKPVRVAYVHSFRPISNKQFKEIVKLGVPASSNELFEEFEDNKGITMDILKEAGIAIPGTIQFGKKPSRQNVEDRVRELFGIDPAVKAEEVYLPFGIVIKPLDWYGGYGVKIPQERLTVTEAVDLILAACEEKEYKAGAMVQRRIVPPTIKIDGAEYDWNYRVFITRDANNRPSVMAVSVRTGKVGGVVNISQGGGLLTFEESVAARGIDAKEEIAKIEQITIPAFEAMQNKAGEPQQDFASIDLMADKDGKLYVIEINGRMSGGILELDHRNEVLLGNGIRAARAFVDTMTRRAKEYRAAQGKPQSAAASPVADKEQTVSSTVAVFQSNQLVLDRIEEIEKGYMVAKVKDALGFVYSLFLEPQENLDIPDIKSRIESIENVNPAQKEKILEALSRLEKSPPQERKQFKFYTFSLPQEQLLGFASADRNLIALNEFLVSASSAISDKGLGRLIKRAINLLVPLLILGSAMDAPNPTDVAVFQKEIAAPSPRPQESLDAISSEKLNNILTPEVRKRIMEAAFTSSIPSELWVDIKQKPPRMIKDLSGYQLLADAETAMDVAIFQAGDIVGLASIADMIEALRKEVKAIVIVNNQFVASLLYRALQGKNIPNLRERIRFVLVDILLSDWARDPYVVLVNPQTKEFTLFPAKGDAGTRLDRHVAHKLMTQGVGLDMFNRNDIRDPTLDMQGGDVTADTTYVFVGSETLHYTRYDLASRPVLTEAEATEKIRSFTGKDVIVLDGPDMHSDRYHLPVGRTKYAEHTSLLADPVMALGIIASLTPREREDAIANIMKTLKSIPPTKEISSRDVRGFFEITPREIEAAKKSEYVRKLEDVKRALEARGIKVIRVPSLPRDFSNNPFGIYYTNALLDGKSAIIPRYFIPKLDETAKRIYQDVGFTETKQITSIITGTAKGGPRCLTQIIAFPTPVVERLPAGSPLAENKQAASSAAKGEERKEFESSAGQNWYHGTPALSDLETLDINKTSGNRYVPKGFFITSTKEYSSNIAKYGGSTGSNKLMREKKDSHLYTIKLKDNLRILDFTSPAITNRSLLQLVIILNNKYNNIIDYSGIMNDSSVKTTEDAYRKILDVVRRNIVGPTVTKDEMDSWRERNPSQLSDFNPIFTKTKQIIFDILIGLGIEAIKYIDDEKEATIILFNPKKQIIEMKEVPLVSSSIKQEDAVTSPLDEDKQAASSAVQENGNNIAADNDRPVQGIASFPLQWVNPNLRSWPRSIEAYATRWVTNFKSIITDGLFFWGKEVHADSDHDTILGEHLGIGVSRHVLEGFFADTYLGAHCHPAVAGINTSAIHLPSPEDLGSGFNTQVIVWGEGGLGVYATEVDISKVNIDDYSKILAEKKIAEAEQYLIERNAVNFYHIEIIPADYSIDNAVREEYAEDFIFKKIPAKEALGVVQRINNNPDVLANIQERREKGWEEWYYKLAKTYSNEKLAELITKTQNEIGALNKKIDKAKEGLNNARELLNLEYDLKIAQISLIAKERAAAAASPVAEKEGTASSAVGIASGYAEKFIKEFGMAGVEFGGARELRNSKARAEIIDNKIYFNSLWLDKMGADEIERVAAHEVQHTRTDFLRDEKGLKIGGLHNVKAFQELQRRIGDLYDKTINEKGNVFAKPKSQYQENWEILSLLRGYKIYLGQMGRGQTVSTQPYEFIEAFTPKDLDFLDESYLFEITKDFEPEAGQKIKIAYEDLKSVSSPTEERDTKGGIDLRALPIVTQQAPKSIGGFGAQPPAGTGPVREIPISKFQFQNLDLNKEWSEIENMLNAGIIPSTERIKEYLANCAQKDNFNQEIDKVLACFADILRLEEERVSATEPELKEFLVLLESDKPAKEFQAALDKIKVSPKEPITIEN